MAAKLHFPFAFFLLLFFIATTAFCASGNIQSITFGKDKDNKNGYSLVFKGKGTLRYSSTVINDPPQILVDFPDTESSMRDQAVKVEDNALVSKIHTGQKLEPGNVAFQVVI